MSNAFKVFIPVLFLIVVILLGATYLVNALGSLDAHSNVSAAYQGQYNDTRDTTITAISITKELPLIIAGFLICAVVLMFAKSKKLF